MGSGRSKSLAELVRIYRRSYGPRLGQYLRYFQRLGSAQEAIAKAASATGADGKVYGHQRRVGKAKLGQASERLLRNAARVAASGSFDDLQSCVARLTKPIHRFGVLAVYDTSLRLGAYFDLWPEVVYLHAGTKRGCQALGIKTSKVFVEMVALPKAMQSLKPFQAEDFLCIFKGQFRAHGQRPTACLPKPRRC